MTIPLKHRPDGLGEFEPNDVVPIEHGGTGSSTLLDAQNVLGITDKLDRSEYIQHFKGVFTSYAALTAAFPTASDGDYAHIDSGSGFDRMVAIWDSSDTKWVVTQANAGANTDEVPEGSQNLYFKNQRVLATILEGLVAGTNAELLPTDNVITAFQKLQAQVKALNTVWVRADQVGSIHSNIIPSMTVGSETMYLEFAKIGGLLWVRGGLTLKSVAMSASSPDYVTPGFVTFNNNYKMQALEKGGAMKTIAVTPNAFTTDESLTRVLFWSDRVCMNQTQANTAVQTLCATSNLYANSTLRIFPTCIGVLL